MTFWKMKHYGDSKRSVVAMAQGEREDKWTEDIGCQHSEIILYETILVDKCHYIYFQNPQSVQH